jgi:ribonuclease HI
MIKKRKTAVNKRKFKIYCDGSSTQNKPLNAFNGGWGAIILPDLPTDLDELRIIELCSGEIKNTTNNRMELRAFIHSFYKLIKDFQFNSTDCTLTVVSDSNYLITGINEWLPNWRKNNWKAYNKKTITNIDLWKEINKILIEYGSVINFQWIKAHQRNVQLSEDMDIYFNNMADKLASNRDINEEFREFN